jgi:hypothetical protein
MNNDAEFTPVNAVAYDLLRSKAQPNEVLPCWLCLAEDQKQLARQNLLWIMRAKTGKFTLSQEEMAALVEKLLPPGLVEKWKAAELAMEAERQKGNPLAYFAH